jgi:hypothetical protein
MRARNPCLFLRFRLCGLYVGFPMCLSLQRTRQRR